MPEMPQVRALAQYLGEALTDEAIESVEIGSLNVLKTYQPQPSALAGGLISGVGTYGKWLDIDVDGLHLVTHFSRAGWMSLRESAPTAPLRPGGKGSVAARLRLASGGALDITEAGTKHRLAIHLVSDPLSIEAIASLGPDPLVISEADFAALLAGTKRQIKGLLRDQEALAGIGNAYSDEILHAAGLSPFAPASGLDERQVQGLFAAMQRVLSEAITAAQGLPPNQLKDDKRAQMAVHGRAGEACPVCADTVRQVSFSDSSLEYCPTCQTEGKILADRRTSAFVK